MALVANSVVHDGAYYGHGYGHLGHSGHLGHLGLGHTSLARSYVTGTKFV